MSARTQQLHRRRNMKWITREHVKVDRVACPWLIKKFVDKDAEFLFVPARPGDGRGRAPRRHPVRRQGRRAGPPRQGMLVRGDPEEVRARPAIRRWCCSARSSTAPTPTTRCSTSRRARASRPSPKASATSASRTTTSTTPPSGSSTTRSMPTAGRWSSAASRTATS